MKTIFIFFLLASVIVSAVACQDPAAEYTKKGTAYFDQEKWAEAVSEYSRALEADPNYVEALTNRGSAYTHLGRYDEALIDLNKAVELDSRNIIPYYNRAILFLYMARYDDAIADCNTIIDDLEMEYHWVYFHRAQAYKGKGDKLQAAADFLKAREISDSPEFNLRIDEELGKLQ